MAKVLLIEPFYSGSHKQLMDVLHTQHSDLVTLPGKKWQWRARTSALWFSQNIEKAHNYRTLFASSVLNLAELIALRPDLLPLHKVLYFHENQLVYPVRKQQERDFQYGYNQILSSLVADVVVFNSEYNMESFLANISSHLKLIPDHRPKNIADQIRHKCHVLHFPILFPPKTESLTCSDKPETYSDIPEIRRDKSEACSDRFETVNVDLGRQLSDVLLMRAGGEITEKNDDVSAQKCTSSTEDSDLCVHDVCNTDFSNEVLGTARENSVENQMTPEENGALHGDIHESNIKHTADREKLNNESDNEVPNKKLRIDQSDRSLHVLWPHRWEHDKDPELFFRVMLQLKEAGVNFKLSVLGETYTDVPDVFEESRVQMSDHILHWGYQPSRQDYYTVLRAADCVVSTAQHEFFGVAMLEAVHLGCYPLCPNKLVYPEIFPKECLYNTEKQLFKKLREFCRKPKLVRQRDRVINTEQYSWNALKSQFSKLLQCDL